MADPEYTLSPTQSEQLDLGPDDADAESGAGSGEDRDICGEEMSDGSICDRDPDDCRYHG